MVIYQVNWASGKQCQAVNSNQKKGGENQVQQNKHNDLSGRVLMNFLLTFSMI